ncbi:uncharacterized protein P174DRAFT_424072 [Aspergillus novofumigatus IBT 16806]|uniref:Uncharacterized protein n=1 Tax=Aspergillus novofumigatus (strain IBT 16806) TaxID=1392255 RepID=A0A2I1C0S6_ASPN1|nr:uncharacterized protein P174DRAFT_424072 [Aspergillus novofumigatus IBT 16806]PKX91242.1 hypothetical protein P174DRAFT_424072 [Aspergillus novofumigatus IBT 16806]
MRIIARFCDVQYLVRLRLVARRLNETCCPLVYRILAQEILHGKSFHLQRAIARCDPTAIDRLLEQGAPVAQWDAEGETPLHKAARNKLSRWYAEATTVAIGR